MPGWHARTKDLVAEGQLQVYGIAPEQYGDRMALFLQWKELNFPVLMDPLNVLGVKAVPITLLVDQHGVIRYRNPKAKDLKAFLETDYPEEKRKSSPPLSPQVQKALQALQSEDIEKVDSALRHLPLRSSSKESATTAFQAGVLSRWIYDHGGSPQSFQTAVEYWQKALTQTPSQYIWRRRIQQYGPRLDKPYPFYDWVRTARQAIKSRGEVPITLQVEPSGSEVALPQRKNEPLKQSHQHPDPQNKLPSTDQLLNVVTTLIPHTDDPDKGRLHLRLTPTQKAHWTSDAQEVQLWLQPKDGKPIFLSDTVTFLEPNQESSSQYRTLEADLTPSQLQGGAKLVLFYSLCEEENAICRFLKTELEPELKH